jgi:predicted kinase
MTQPTVRKLIATIGLPGSGKTTWALKQVDRNPDGVCRSNRDAIRVAHAGRRLGTPAQEAIVTRAQHEMIRAAFAYGYHTVIVDDTNLHGTGALERLAADLGVTFSVRDFRHVPLTTCLQRNRTREGGARLPEDVIRRMHDERILPALRAAQAREARNTNA